MRTVSAVMLLAAGLSCIGPRMSLEEKMASGASAEIGCPAADLMTEKQEDGLRDAGTVHSSYWMRYLASGCDRAWFCDYTADPERTTCKETPQSQARSVRNLVVDRLALETGCPREKIAIEQQGEWSRGGEAAFRMTACGKRYVCSSAPGRATDCKPALAE